MENDIPEVCLICLVEQEIHLPTKESDEIVNSCTTYLHTAIVNSCIKEALHPFRKSKNIPLCKNCFDSASKLAELTQQVSQLQKQIADSSVSFSLSVLHRRTQVSLSKDKNNFKTKTTQSSSRIITLDVTDLTPELFPWESEDKHLDLIALTNKCDSNNVFISTENNIQNTDNIQGIQCTGQECDSAKYIIPNNAPNCFSQEEEFNEVYINIGDSKDPNNSNVEDTGEYKIDPLIFEDIVLDSQRLENTSTKVEPVDDGDAESLMRSVKLPSIQLNRLDDDKKKHAAAKLIKDSIIIENSLNCGTQLPGQSKRKKSKRGDSSTKAVNKAGHSNLKKPKKWRKKSPHWCSLCKKSFGQKTHYNEHLRIHTGERPFPCSYCDKSFRVHRSLIRHIRIHTQEKPFQCHICNVSFREKHHVVKHLKSHVEAHTGIERPPFPSNI